MTLAAPINAVLKLYFLKGEEPAKIAPRKYPK